MKSGITRPRTEAETIQDGADVVFTYRRDPLDGTLESSLTEAEVIRVARWARDATFRETQEAVEHLPATESRQLVLETLDTLRGAAVATGPAEDDIREAEAALSRAILRLERLTADDADPAELTRTMTGAAAAALTVLRAAAGEARTHRQRGSYSPLWLEAGADFANAIIGGSDQT